MGPRLVLALLVLATLLSRLLLLHPWTNMWDSAAFVANVRTMLAAHRFLFFTNLDQGHPLYLQLGALCAWCARVLGAPAPALLGLKLAGVVATALAVVPYGWLARWLLGARSWALWASAFFAFSPLVWWWSGEAMSDAMGVAFAVGALGCLVRGLALRRRGCLAAGALLLGANPLVRFTNVLLWPLGVALVWRRRGWRAALPVLGLLCLPVPLYVAAAWAQEPARTLGSFFVLPGQVEPRLADALVPRKWVTLGMRLVHGLGPAGAAAALLGIALGWRRAPRAVLLAAAWALPFVVLVSLYPSTPIRYLLPVVPPAAWLAALACGRLGRRWGGWAAAALVGLAVAYALPLLRELRTRANVLDAVARWYARHTPPEALIVTRGDDAHVRLWSGRRTIFSEPMAYRERWVGELAPGLPVMLAAVDAALAAGRPVYASDLLGPDPYGNLERYYWLEPVGRLAGAGLRQQDDLGFEALRMPTGRRRDVRFFRLWLRPVTPRAAPPPRAVRVQAVPAGLAVTLTLAVPRAPGATAAPLVARAAWALDLTDPDHGRDPWLRRLLPELRRCLAPLGPDGRGELRFLLRGAALRRLAVSYVLFDGAGRLAAVGAPVSVPVPGVWRASPPGGP